MTSGSKRCFSRSSEALLRRWIGPRSSGMANPSRPVVALAEAHLGAVAGALELEVDEPRDRSDVHLELQPVRRASTATDVRVVGDGGPLGRADLVVEAWRPGAGNAESTCRTRCAPASQSG